MPVGSGIVSVNGEPVSERSSEYFRGRILAAVKGVATGTPLVVDFAVPGPAAPAPTAAAAVDAAPDTVVVAATADPDAGAAPAADTSGDAAAAAAVQLAERIGARFAIRPDLAFPRERLKVSAA